MTNDQARMLSERLPHGYLPKAAAKLADLGHTYTWGTISRVKSGAIENEVILHVLLDLAAEEDRRRARLDRLVRGEQPVNP